MPRVRWIADIFEKAIMMMMDDQVVHMTRHNNHSRKIH